MRTKEDKEEEDRQSWRFFMSSFLGVKAMKLLDQEMLPMDGWESVPEHERRFVPRNREYVWERVAYCESVRIRQGYFFVRSVGKNGEEKNRRFRIRQEEGLRGMIYTLTRKKKIKGSEISRDERNRPISEEEFRLYWEYIECSLEKVRYFLDSEKGICIEVNMFPNGYIQIEVEFDSEELAKAFRPPEWFGREVTNEKHHKGYALAKEGAPKEEW